MPETGKILIADGDDVFRCTMSEILEREGHVCSGVSKISSVMELITQEQFDVLIADIRMPGNNQLELIQLLSQKVPYLSVLVVTDYPSLQTALRSIQLQVLAYLVKPFAVEQLLTEVRNALSRTKLTRVMLSLQNRWREWSDELQAKAAMIRPDAAKNGDMLTALVDASLQNLARCFMDLRDLRQVLRGENPIPESDPALESMIRDEKANLGLSQKPFPFFISAQQTADGQGALPTELRDKLQQLSRREREVLRLLLTNRKPQMIAETLFISPYTVRNHIRSIFDKLDVHSQTELFSRFAQHTAYMDFLQIV